MVPAHDGRFSPSVLHNDDFSRIDAGGLPEYIERIYSGLPAKLRDVDQWSVLIRHQKTLEHRLFRGGRPLYDIVNLYDSVPAEAWTKKFVVDIEAVDEGRSIVAYLAPYGYRVAIGDDRSKWTLTRSLCQYMPSKTHTLLTRTVTGQEFMAGFMQHILPKRFRKVRYHGRMTSNSKARLQEIRVIVWMALGWIYWLASGHAPRAKSKAVSPFRCRHCHGRMQVCEVVFQAVCLQQLNQPPATILPNHSRISGRSQFDSPVALHVNVQITLSC